MHDCKKGRLRLSATTTMQSNWRSRSGLPIQSSGYHLVKLPKTMCEKARLYPVQIHLRPNNICKHTSNFRLGFDW